MKFNTEVQLAQLDDLLHHFVGVDRLDWHVYFMTIAKFVATRATCDRKRVGCVITIGKRIVATGYNGSMPNVPHCDTAGHLLDGGRCVRTVHAEANAIGQAAKYGTKIGTAGAVAYVTASPCRGCFKLLVNSGVETIVYSEPYRVEEISRDAADAKVALMTIRDGQAVDHASVLGIDPSIVRFVSKDTYRVDAAGRRTLCTHLLGPCACGKWHTDDDNVGNIRSGQE